MIVLGIETSCDETAAAVVATTPHGPRILSNQIQSQFEEHGPFGGIVPEIAARAHLDRLDTVIDHALAEVTRALANHKISISSVIQHEAFDGPEGDVVPLIIMTHTASTGSFQATLAEIDRLDCVTAPSVYYHVGN